MTHDPFEPLEYTPNHGDEFDPPEARRRLFAALCVIGAFAASAFGIAMILANRQ